MSTGKNTVFTVPSGLLNGELKTPLGNLILLEMAPPSKTEENKFSIFLRKERAHRNVSRTTLYFNGVEFLDVETGVVYTGEIVCKPGCVDEKTGEFKFSQQGETNYVTLMNVPIRTASVDEYARAYERMLAITGQLGEPGDGCCDDILLLVKKHGHKWHSYK